MSLFWLTPLAWTGLVLVAVPIAIHLLARQRSVRVPFPALRFIPASQLAALRARAIAEWPLLLVRIAILVLAVAAAAGPVLVSASRTLDWQTRVARAVVLTDDREELVAFADEQARDSFATARFADANVANAIRDSATWLERQPPAAREVVVIGALHEGDVAAGDWAVLPRHVGVRFLPVPSSRTPGAELRGVADVAGTLTGIDIVVEAGESETRASYQARDLAMANAVQLVAAPGEQAYADALLRAVFLEGVLLRATPAEPGPERGVSIVFDGALRGEPAAAAPPDEWMREVLIRHPEVRGGVADGRFVVNANMPVSDPRAPELVASLVRGVFAPSFRGLEARPISPATLAAWSRPPAAIPDNVRPGDEGDRRWLWGAALLMLGVEHVMRRRRPHA